MLRAKPWLLSLSHSVPVFLQVSDVVMLSPAYDVGARNERHLVAVYSNKESGFEVVHGMLNRVMEAVGVPYKGKNCTECLLPDVWSDRFELLIFV